MASSYSCFIFLFCSFESTFFGQLMLELECVNEQVSVVRGVVGEIDVFEQFFGERLGGIGM